MIDRTQHIDALGLQINLGLQQGFDILDPKSEMLDPARRFGITPGKRPRVVGKFKKGDAAAVFHLEKNMDVRAVGAR
ncbi:hypothetical protein D3C86_1812230 [compost metagenome]